MSGKKFQRTIEDFVCEHCGNKTKGDGYTNHCPVCLWSKHVDVSPGDRAETCGGKMKPVALEGSTPTYRLTHRCETCGVERRITIRPDDSSEAILRLAREQAAQ